MGKISLPSTTLRFFDLGGQRDIRSIWPKYYDECHAVVFVLDAVDQGRLAESWQVFGAYLHLSPWATLEDGLAMPFAVQKGVLAAHVAAWSSI